MSDTKRNTAKNTSRHKKMKTMLEAAGLPNQMKASTAFAGRPPIDRSTTLFVRLDGSEGKDKTLGLHSRPGAKQKARNTNRAHVKKARQILKRQLNEQRSETSDSGS